MDSVIFLPLFVLGLVSSAHCIGMCGGIMGALTMAIPAEAKGRRVGLILAYNLGRIASYSLMGALAGLFAAQIAALGGALVLRLVAGLLLIAMGLYLADWWRGLTRLETVGRYLWVYLQPFSKHLMPVDKMPKALLLGAIWGWLPCGLVYSALGTAMTQPSPLLASGAMLAFGLGTLPAVSAAGLAAGQLTRMMQNRGLRRALAVAIILFGVWTIVGSAGHEHQHSHGLSAADQNTSGSEDHQGHSAMGHEHHHH